MAPSTFLDTKQIHHCIDTTELVGGTEIYVANLIRHRTDGISDRILTSLRDVDQSQFKLLHIHRREVLLEYRGECPAIYTVHNHSSYCSSGTKYLRHQQRCCDRNLSLTGCAWGHFVDGCGSRRPQKFIHKFRDTANSLHHLKRLKIPVIANSNYVRQQLINNGLPSHQVTTLHCTIQPPVTSPSPLKLKQHQNHRFLFVGRLDPMKGLEWLLQALATLDNSIHLDIAGDGWYRANLEKLSNQLQIANRITWHGWCNQKQLSNLYQNCTALVVPSIWPEPAGLVTLEAYAHARPVIASFIGGIPEYVRDNETGLLIQPNNIKELAAAMLRLDRDYLLSRDMGNQGYSWLTSKLSFVSHIEALQHLYIKAIENFKENI